MDKNALSTRPAIMVPACSIEEKADAVMVRLELPGVPKDGLEVKVEGNSLTIEGRREVAATSGTYLLRERREGSYRKVFTLDETIDHDRVDAELANGILTLRLHLREAAKPRRIAIN
jgi:HSP20 family protein